MEWIALLVAAIATVGVLAARVVARAETAQHARRLPDGTQEALVVVDHGYTPSRIELDAGVPATLRFDRREDDPCSEMLVSELWPNAYRLAAHRETPIRFTPQRPGRYAFTCGMGMYSGELVVRP